jgi:prolyl oligopeptidase
VGGREGPLPAAPAILITVAWIGVAAALWAVMGLGLVQPAPADPLSPLGVGVPPPAPSKTPVTETLHGMSLTDEWRGMEALAPQTLDWMKAQGAYTRTVLDAIKPLAALRARVAAFTGSFGFVNSYSVFGGRAFYEERAPGSDNYDLMVRDPGGPARKLIDVAALRAAHGGTPYAINYIVPSPDGTKVAAGISAGGSEDALLFVYEAASGAQIAGPLDRARFGISSWSNDSRMLFVLRQKKLEPGEPATDFERYVQMQVWDLAKAPVPLAGAGSGHGPEISPDEFPFISITPGSDVAVLGAKSGVRNEVRLWTAPADQAAKPDVRWTPLAGYEDGITTAAVRGDTLFLLSHKGAPTFQVLELKGGEPLSAARVLVAARPDRILDNLTAAADGFYVESRDGVYSHLLRAATGSGATEEVALPEHGHMGSLFSDPRAPGVVVEMSSWVSPPAYYGYDPVAKTFADLHLGVRGDIRSTDFEVRDLTARARDGVEVPLSLVLPRAERPGPRITVIEAYGSYGISELADFFPSRELHEGGDRLCRLPRARRGRAGRGLAPGRQGRRQAQHLARPDRLRRRPRRAGDYSPGSPVHPGRIGRRHHHGPGHGRAARAVRRRARPGPGGQHGAFGIHTERAAEHPRIRHDQGRGRPAQPL